MAKKNYRLYGKKNKNNKSNNPITIARKAANWMADTKGLYRLYHPEIDGSYNDIEAHRIKDVIELKRKPSLAVFIDPDGTLFKGCNAKETIVFTRDGHKVFTADAQVIALENPAEIALLEMAMNAVLSRYPKTFGRKRRPKVAVYAKFPLAAAIFLTMECPHIDFYIASNRAMVKKSGHIDEVVANFCLIRKYCRLNGGLEKVLGDKLDTYWPITDKMAAKYSRHLDENTAEVLQLTGALLRLAQRRRERELAKE